MKEIIKLFKSGLAYTRLHPQLIMTVVLVLVIPIAFVVSGLQFLNAAQSNQISLEKSRVGVLQDTFASIMRLANYDPIVIQQEMTVLAQQNIDIVDFKVMVEDGPYLKVIAALSIDEIGSLQTVTTEDRYSNIQPERSFISPLYQGDTRFWETRRLVRSSEGTEYFVVTVTSHEQIDALFAKNTMVAFYWLFALLAIVMLLVFRHLKLIDYAALYTETKKAGEAKDMFTNMIAHELRAPLTAMKGYASLIRERSDIPDEVRTYGARIQDSADRLVLIVNDLLDVARIHSGKLALNPSEVRVQDVITLVLETMQASAHEKHIMLSQETLPLDVVLFLDGKRLTQALTNLVSNAIKYTKAGAIALSLEDKDTKIEIRVKDTGMGISAENQRNLFAPFFRVSSPDVDHTIGTGLGMWITKQLIELMKGTIEVESIKGVGTHVVVTFPKVTFLKTETPSK